MAALTPAAARLRCGSSSRSGSAAPRRALALPCMRVTPAASRRAASRVVCAAAGEQEQQPAGGDTPGASAEPASAASPPPARAAAPRGRPPPDAPASGGGVRLVRVETRCVACLGGQRGHALSGQAWQDNIPLGVSPAPTRLAFARCHHSDAAWAGVAARDAGEDSTATAKCVRSPAARQLAAQMHSAAR
jgi:hypothetical protein